MQIRPGMKLLDVGCGGGSFLRVARELGAEVAGVEPSDAGVNASRACGLDVFHGTLDDYVEDHEGAASFDLITANHVIEHAPDPVRTLSQAGRLLSAGGVIWIAVPNSECTAARALGWRWHSADLPIHLMHFSRSSIEAAIRRAGLQIRRIESYSLPRGVRGSLAQILRHKLMMPGRIAHWLSSRGFAHRYAERVGQRWDRTCDGEALLVQIQRPGPDQVGTA